MHCHKPAITRSFYQQADWALISLLVPVTERPFDEETLPTHYCGMEITGVSV